MFHSNFYAHERSCEGLLLSNNKIKKQKSRIQKKTENKNKKAKKEAED
jgi:hypothetical protein